MTPEMMSKLRRSLIQHEDFRKFPYIDTVGKVTIGIGYNLTDRGIDDEWINQQYKKDVNYFHVQLSQFAWYSYLNSDRKIILIDMAFMGWKNFLSFKKMIDALSRFNFQEAAYEMLNSKWAHQVQSRAVQLAEAMMKGVYVI